VVSPDHHLAAHVGMVVVPGSAGDAALAHGVDGAGGAASVQRFHRSAAPAAGTR